METRDFLLEIGCEELPARAQESLSLSLGENIHQRFSEAHLSFGEMQCFATPRRIAVLVRDLETKQQPQEHEKQGPSFEKAYSKDGSPTLACLGFAKSCGVTIDELIVKETEKGKRIVCMIKEPGRNTSEMLPKLVEGAVAKIAMPKPMRWGKHKTTFIRPVHWVVMLFDQVLVPATILGVKTSRETFGHRFHHPKKLMISKPQDYNVLLYTQGHVIANFSERKKQTKKALEKATRDNNRVVIDEQLLDEVTALVEWPVVLKGTFDKKFLALPDEVLITSMKTHQKCFPVVSPNGKLEPYFILVSNIESKDPETVIKGNERVIRARLSDAEFFYEKDIKHKLSDHLPQLNDVVFQEVLGSIGDKTKRITKLASFIAKTTNGDEEIVKHAATLCKCDLVTDMVGEFPSLQGIMGYYYALHDKEAEACAIAIKEQYLPKFSGDTLPSTEAGYCLALADRIDTIVGILGINKAPTGDKDPFALRRAALGVLRILIEKKIDLDLITLIKKAKKDYSVSLSNDAVIQDTHDFIMARLKYWYIDQGVPVEVFEAVMAREPSSLIDFDRRVKAVLQFQLLPEASSLAAANKRVSNILKKESANGKFKETNSALFECNAERTLAKQLETQAKTVDQLYDKADYTKALTQLSTLKEPIDQFFDDVLIMVDDKKTRQNRLALLASIRALFTKVADISLLP